MYKVYWLYVLTVITFFCLCVYLAYAVQFLVTASEDYFESKHNMKAKMKSISRFGKHRDVEIEYFNYDNDSEFNNDTKIVHTYNIAFDIRRHRIKFN